MKSGIFFLLIASAVLARCVHQPEVFSETEPETPPVVSENCDPDTAYFQTQVLPIFISNCAIPTCHDAVSREEGIVLDKYENIRKEVRAGDANDSEIYEVLLDNDPEKLMPRDPTTGRGYRLPTDQIALIRTWINQGAKNNSCASCDTTDYSYAGAIKAIVSLNCATSGGCHGTGSVNGDFTSYQTLSAKVASGVLAHRTLVLQDMPPGKPLPACQQDLIRRWIENGASNN